MPELFIFLLTSLLFLYHISTSNNFNPDLGRDFTWIWDILHGTFTLLGPKLSFGGYYSGPYYYYFFAPFLWLSRYQPAGVLWANALLASLALSLIFFYLRKSSGLFFAVLSVGWLAVTPYILFSARNPGNAYSYITVLILYLIMISQNKKNTSLRYFLGMGIFAGLLINFHPASLFASIPFTFFALVSSEKKEKVKQIFTFILGVVLTMTPLIFFELRHNFIMFRNTFIDKSYTAFMNPESRVSMVKHSNNLFEQLAAVHNLLSEWMIPSIVAILILIVFLSLYQRTVKKFSVASTTLIVTIIFAVLLQYQVTFYYVFPLLCALQAGLLLVLIKQEKIALMILGACLLLTLVSFPRNYYSLSNRNFFTLQAKSQAAVNALPIPPRGFNIVYISNNPLTALGYEYRYIFRTLGKVADGEQQYGSSTELLIVSEKGPLDFSTLHTWEIDTFGKKKLIKSYQRDDIIFYLFRKEL